MDNIQKIVKCNICARECYIKEGAKGWCGKYTIKNGNLTEILPDSYLVICCISIETMPMLHFYPKGKFLQITTTGCNFNCPGCVSTVLVKELGTNNSALQYKTPGQIIEMAKQENCIGISFLMNDPLASYFTFLNVAKAAKQANLLVGCSTNGYFTENSSRQLAPYLDFINIGIKGFSDNDYKDCGGESIKPVLKSIKIFHELNVHIEISCTYKKDDDVSIKKLALWMEKSGYNIPLQIMRYIPLEGADPRLESTVSQAEKICQSLKEFISYVYLFNSPGTDFLNTYCPNCGSLLIERDFYGPMGAKVKEIYLGSDCKCPKCKNYVPIKGLQTRADYKEKAFEGGYPFTRALEMIQAILIACGVDNLDDVVKVWVKMLEGDNMNHLHHDLQSIEQYILTVAKYAKHVGLDEKATELTSYMKEKVSEIKEKLKNVKNKPRVYYAMGKPLFCIKDERFENQIVTAAGGISVNKEIKGDGRPGFNITVEELNRLNPDVIFISSFLSNTTEDFYHDCVISGIKVNAVLSKRIFTHPYPNWDFGSPRWILGLMNIANILHPGIFKFDIYSEANNFYRLFYNIDFNPCCINLSFAKPTNNWQWKN